MVSVRITVLETEAYIEKAEDLFTPEEREGIRAFLAVSPDAGDVIPGLKGLRKMRWTEERRQKGKRGGARVVYFYASSRGVIALLYAYSKKEKEDLTNANRKELKAALEKLKKASGIEGEDAVRGRPSKRN
jgi:hypothetical protein